MKIEYVVHTSYFSIPFEFEMERDLFVKTIDSLDHMGFIKNAKEEEIELQRHEVMIYYLIDRIYSQQSEYILKLPNEEWAVVTTSAHKFSDAVLDFDIYVDGECLNAA